MGAKESLGLVGLENLSRELNVVHLESCQEEEKEGKEEAPTEIKLANLNAQHEYLSERANFMRKEELEKEGEKEVDVVTTIFKLGAAAKEAAHIAGTFNRWKKVAMVRTSTDFVAVLELPVGVHEFNFYLDGEWKCDQKLPWSKDHNGCPRNLINVRQDEFGVLSALDFDQEERSGHSKVGADLESDFGQVVPEMSAFECKAGPPVLPPHLLQIILNKDTPLSCEPTLLPEPNHVMLNHLYALSIKDRVIVLASTQRYKKKYVTTLLYKPIALHPV